MRAGIATDPLHGRPGPGADVLGSWSGLKSMEAGKGGAFAVYQLLLGS